MYTHALTLYPNVKHTTWHDVRYKAHDYAQPLSSVHVCAHGWGIYAFVTHSEESDNSCSSLATDSLPSLPVWPSCFPVFLQRKWMKNNVTTLIIDPHNGNILYLVESGLFLHSKFLFYYNVFVRLFIVNYSFSTWQIATLRGWNMEQW